ncbi:histone H1A, sperm [Aplysia californica]|uniref:Histone H1A, sperm n=1 Tax=Aplysia californica TaxID=6500 RepID=A0ABM0K393_APLCA|nr:histone H1A, sperm [Aplysia californica]
MLPSLGGPHIVDNAVSFSRAREANPCWRKANATTMDVNAEHVVEAVKALQNPKGSTAHEIKRFLVSEGHIDKSADVKLAILAALKSNRVARPQGARGRFLFWGSKGSTEGSKLGRCKPKKKKRRKPKRASCGRKRKPKRKKRSKKSCGKKRKPRKPKKKKCGGKRKKSNKMAMTCSGGKELVIFCARKPKPKPKKC